MARLVNEEGLHIDVASEGELFTAIAAGVPGERIVFHGNNKSLTELSAARTHAVGRVVVDSFDELSRLRHLHEIDGLVAQIQLRVLPELKPTPMNTSQRAKTIPSSDSDWNLVLPKKRCAIARPTQA